MSKKKFYIVCKRHMHRKDGAILFWGPNRCGYRYGLEHCGLYTEEEAKGFDRPELDMAVPQELVESLAVTRVIDRKELGKVCLNTKEVRRELGIQLNELLKGETVWTDRVFLEPDEFVRLYQDIVAIMTKIAMQKRCRCEGNKAKTYVRVCKNCGGYYDGGGI